MRRAVTCTDCNGMGGADPALQIPCSACNETGIRITRRQVCPISQVLLF